MSALVLPPKYENLTFERYEELYHQFTGAAFKPEKVETLDSSNKKHIDVPPLRPLKFMTGLITLDLTNNNISRFSFQNLVVGAPNLRNLFLQKNKIDVLDDLVELGSLKHLHELNILENPVCGYLLRIKIVQFLLFPEKYKTYDAVKILTATYDSMTIKTTLTPGEERERKNYERFMEKTAPEVDKKELQKSRVNKYDHKNTLIKNARVACPVPRTTRFPNLVKLNGKDISVTDIESITLQPFRNVVLKQDDIDMPHEVTKIEHSAQHYKYLEKYKKKMERRALEQGSILYLAKKNANDGDVDDLKALSQIDQENYNRQKMYSGVNNALWEKPLDVKYKNDPGFSISMEEYKQMIKDYEAEKLRKKDEKNRRIKRMREKIVMQKKLKEKRRKQRGKFTVDFDIEEDVINESYHNIDSDPELKRLFNIKKKKRPKANLELQNDQASFLNSSESELDEFEKRERHASDESMESTLKRFAHSFSESESSFEYSKEPNPKFQKSGSERRSESVTKPGLGLPIVSESHNKLDGPLTDDSHKNRDNNKERKNFFQKSKEKRREFTNRVFTTKEEAERQERERKRIEDQETAQREAEIIRESKSKRGTGLTISKRLQFDKRASGKTSRRSSADSKHSGQDGEKSPFLATPVSRSNFDEPRSDTLGNKEMNRDRTSRNDLLRVDDMTPSTSHRKDISPRVMNEKLHQLTVSYNFTSAHRSINEMIIEEEAPKGEENQTQSKDTVTSPQSILESQQIKETPEQNNLGDDYFNFKGSIKPQLDVDMLSNIQSTIQSKDHSQVLADGKEDLTASNIGEIQKRALEKFSNVGNASFSKDEPRRDINTSRPDERVQSGYLEQLTQPDESPTELQKSELNPLAEAPQNRFHNSVIRSYQAELPKLSIYETAQNFLKQQQRPGTSGTTVSTTLISPATLQGQSDHRLGSSYHQKRVKVIRQQDSKSYKITNKIFFNRAKETEKLKNNLQTLPPAPSHKKLYEKQGRSVSNLKASIISQQPSQNVGLYNNKDSKSNLIETMKSLNEEDFRPATANHITKSSTVSHLMGGSSRAVFSNKTPADTRAANRPELTPPHLNRPPAAVTVETLIPRPEEGVSESMKLKILNERDANYEKMSEIVQLIETSRNLREEILSVLGPSSSSHVGTDKKTISFSKITEFLMQKSKTDKLRQEDKDDLRDLIYSVNDYNKNSIEPKLTYDWIDSKLTDVVKKGDKTYDVDKLYEYLDILKSIDDKKVNTKNTNMLKQVEKKEIERAEHNAVLAAHYQRLKKYYGEEFITKHFKEYHTLNQNEQQLAEAHKQQKAKNLRTPEIILTATGKYARKDLGTEYESRVKTKHNMDYAVGELKPVEIRGSWAEEWPNINEIFNARKQKVRKMERFEDMFEFFQRKMADEFNKKDQKVLTMEEKMIRYAQDFKENSKKREILKQNVDKNIREIRKNLDEFVELNTVENDRRHDKEYCFREYVKAMREGQL